MSRKSLNNSKLEAVTDAAIAASDVYSWTLLMLRPF